ncbi:MAG: hypothetical protein M3Z29_09170 [Pseudomonadota bacterium]|nr:hypothetical protein [Pseudomonadota bacterium]
MNQLRSSGRRPLGGLAATTVLALAAAFAAPSHAADAKTGAADAQARQERADCESGRTGQDRATCLKEVGAAQAERKRNQLDNNGSASQNSVERCNLVAAKDKADCLARVQGPSAANQRVNISGSVAGGGVIKETTTTTRGPVVVIPVEPAPSASASK